MQPDARVVVVTYNSAPHIESCLKALAASSNRTLEVVVIDNASDDATVDLIRARFPDTQVIENHTNIGFAAAVNRASRGANTQWILLLNPDTELEVDSLEHLLSFASRNPTHLLYGGRTLDENGNASTSAWSFPTPWSLACYALGLNTLFAGSRLFDPEPISASAHPTIVDALSGCYLLIDADLFNEVGGMDERYAIYGEDLDFAWKSRAVGASPVLVPEARVKHAIGASSTTRVKGILSLRGRLTFFMVRYPVLGSLWARLCITTGVGLRAAVVRTLQAALRRDIAASFWLQLWRDRALWQRGWIGASDLRDLTRSLNQPLAGGQRQ